MHPPMTQPVSTGQLRTEQVLVVEDSDAAREVLAIKLRREG